MRFKVKAQPEQLSILAWRVAVVSDAMESSSSVKKNRLGDCMVLLFGW